MLKLVKNHISELKKMLKINTALLLFKNAKFSLEQASRFANISLYDFMTECSKNQIPVISYEENELVDEMQRMVDFEKELAHPEPASKELKELMNMKSFDA